MREGEREREGGREREREREEEREKGRIHGEVKVQFRALIPFTCTCEQVPLCAIRLFHGTVLPFLSATEEVSFNNSIMETVDCREILGWILFEARAHKTWYLAPAAGGLRCPTEHPGRHMSGRSRLLALTCALTSLNR